MYSLARLCMERGIRISGYDKTPGKYSEMLRACGVRVSYGADFMTASSATLVVYSLAIDIRDEELRYTASLGIPSVSRADFLSYIIQAYKTTVGISGTHGKSTVTSMIHAIFSEGGKEPTTLVGAPLPSGEPCAVGGSDICIYESCEYGDSFLCMRPSAAVITNIEYDHPDYFDDEGAVVNSFLKCINGAKDLAILPQDDKNTARLLPKVRVPYVTYGTSSTAEYRYTIDEFGSGGSEFSIFHGTGVEKYRISLVGSYNVANAVCAAVTAREYGIDARAVRAALLNFQAPPRRLERIGVYRGREVFYDYAHHPTEIAAAIGAVKTWYSDAVTVIFKPHTYTRTKALWSSFARSLSLADSVILTDIYAAREEPIFDITSKRLAVEIGKRAVYSSDEDILSALAGTDGAIIIMGAGEVELIKNIILSAE